MAELSDQACGPKRLLKKEEKDAAIWDEPPKSHCDSSGFSQVTLSLATPVTVIPVQGFSLCRRWDDLRRLCEGSFSFVAWDDLF